MGRGGQGIGGGIERDWGWVRGGLGGIEGGTRKNKKDLGLIKYIYIVASGTPVVRSVLFGRTSAAVSTRSPNYLAQLTSFSNVVCPQISSPPGKCKHGLNVVRMRVKINTVPVIDKLYYRSYLPTSVQTPLVAPNMQVGWAKTCRRNQHYMLF